MAKVTGPLHSDGASGKIANAIVFFPWKGLNVVRKWLVPRNPQTAAQGNIRMILGGLGRAGHAPESGSGYRNDAIAVAGPADTYVSAFVKTIIDNYISDGTEFDTIFGVYDAHAAKATFVADGATLGLTDFTVSYKSATEEFTAGFQMYLLAQYGILRRNPAIPAFDRSPYDTALASWTATEVGEMTTDMQA
jgi:hypothetical protein